MRRALEEDQYSANGSIVDTETDEDDHQYVYRGQSVRLDRNYLLQAARKHLWLERVGGKKDGEASATSDDKDDRHGGPKKIKKKGKRGKEDDRIVESSSSRHETDRSGDVTGSDSLTTADHDFERDEGSIFGQTTGQSNSTWVECDKCKKVSF
jgi:hypothetical protein